jgi:hypothetical protein
VLLVLLWLQLALGLATLPLSAQHLDGSMMLKLAEWGAKRIVTFRQRRARTAGSEVELGLQGCTSFARHEPLPDLSPSPAWCTSGAVSAIGRLSAAGPTRWSVRVA